MHLDTHVILVSHQPTPNLTPALDPELKPARVIMLVSPDMGQRAQWLADVLQPRGIRVETRPLADAHDVEDLREVLLDLVGNETGTIALNLTGGTKLMTIAAYEAFTCAGHPIFYVHPDQDRLIWLHPRGLPPRELAHRVGLDPFLRAHGARMTERPASFGVPESLRELTQALVQGIRRYAAGLSTLNWAAMKADAARSLVSPDLGEALARKEFQELLAHFEARGLIAVEGGRLRFADEAARFFANGGWLEQHVYAVAQALKRENIGIQDLARGVEVVRGSGEREVRNELDVAILANNRLRVVECKTRKFSDETATGGAGAEAVYKLDALGNLLGGLKAGAMLVSYQPLRAGIRDRARDYRIETCAFEELKDLKERLQRWIV